MTGFQCLSTLSMEYFFYRAVKGLFKPKNQVQQGPKGEVIDEMVQDPQCKTYIPKKEAIKIVVRGQQYNFCSNECAEKFKQESG